MRRNTAILPFILILNFVCWVCICQQEQAISQDQEEAQIATVFQSMLNYFNEHPFDQSSQPSEAFRSIVNDIRRSESNPQQQQAAAAVDQPVAPAVPAVNVEAIKSSFDSAPMKDSPVAFPAGIPASVAALAAVPPNNQAAVAPLSSSQDNIGISAAADPILKNAAIVQPAIAQVDTAAPVVAPAAEPIPQMKADNLGNTRDLEAAAASVVAPIDAPIIAASLVPVTSIAVVPTYSAEPTVSVIPVPTVPVSPITTAPTTIIVSTPTTSSMVNTASRTTSATRTMTSVSVSRSATPSITTTIPPISAGTSVFDMSFSKTFSLAMVVVLLLQFVV